MDILITPLIIFILIVILILRPFKIVEQQTAFTVETLGKFSRVMFPGFNLFIPIIEKTSRKLNLSTLTLDFSILAITSDKVTITIDTTLVYRVIPEKVYEASYSTDNPIMTIKALVENAIRAFVATQTHEEVIRSRDEMTIYLTDHLKEKISSFGYFIDSFQFRDIILPKDITESMSRVVSSKRLQEAAQNEAEAEYIRAVKTAEGQKEARYLQGQGFALERKAITDGLAESVMELKEKTGIQNEAILSVILMNQYIDMLRNVTNDKNGKTVFLNPSPDGMQNIMQQMTSLISNPGINSDKK
jgi:regulator of protease activity HflC (stomatin/prohibitin superfamily)